MKEKILELYFNEKMLQKEIAKKLNISTSIVSRTLSRDSRFIEKKNRRKIANKVKHNKDIQKRVEQKRKDVQLKNYADELVLKKSHRQASVELSDREHLTNENYRKWNYSAYKYNPSKRRYEFREELGRSYDVPKYIKEKIL